MTSELDLCMSRREYLLLFRKYIVIINLHWLGFSFYLFWRLYIHPHIFQFSCLSRQKINLVLYLALLQTQNSPPIAQQNTSFSPLIAQQNSNTNMGIQLSVHTTWAHYWTADSLREEKSRCGQWSLKVLHRDKRSIKTVAEKNSEEKKRCLIGQLHWFISSPMLSFERWVLYLVPCEKH